MSNQVQEFGIAFLWNKCKGSSLIFNLKVLHKKRLLNTTHSLSYNKTFPGVAQFTQKLRASEQVTEVHKTSDPTEVAESILESIMST